MSQHIALSAHDSVLTLAPETGGSVVAWRWRGEDVLRAGPAGGGPLELAGFAMAPFCGRITEGRFRFEGEEVRLPANFPPEPHAIHGQAWQGAWDVAEVSAGTAHLKYSHAGDIWPWPYRAEQRLRLLQAGLRVDLSVTNLSDRAMPAGLGWHPYFARAGGARLHADVGAIWRDCGGQIAAAEDTPGAEEKLVEPRAVDDLDLDDCFTAGSEGAWIEWPERRLRVHVRPGEVFGFLVVYTPPGEAFFCVEPLSHVPNAVNNPRPAEETGLTRLPPGETLRGRVELQVEQV